MAQISPTVVSKHPEVIRINKEQRAQLGTAACPLAAIEEALVVGTAHALSLSKTSAPEPVIEAAKRCDAKRVKKLLDDGAAVDPKDLAGLTPLMWAAKKNCPNVAELLINHGASLTAKSRSGLTSTQWAACLNREEVSVVLQ